MLKFTLLGCLFYNMYCGKAEFNIKKLCQIRICLGMTVDIENDSSTINQKDFIYVIMKKKI